MTNVKHSRVQEEELKDAELGGNISDCITERLILLHALYSCFVFHQLLPIALLQIEFIQPVLAVSSYLSFSSGLELLQMF